MILDNLHETYHSFVRTSKHKPTVIKMNPLDVEDFENELRKKVSGIPERDENDKSYYRGIEISIEEEVPKGTIHIS